MSAMLEVRDLTVAYGNIVAVKNLSLEVHKGEIVTLIGSNGAGKSTTLRTISGLLTPKTGTVTFNGEVLTGHEGHEVVAKGICHSPEGRRIFQEMTVSENLDLGAFLRDDKEGIEADRENVLELFPRLRERIMQKAGTMSGGEQQMLSLARALASNPALLLLDEMSMGLAPRIVAELYEQVGRIAAEGVSVLVIEQFARTVLGVADWAVVMSHGTVQASGPAAQIGDDVLADAYLGHRD